MSVLRSKDVVALLAPHTGFEELIPLIAALVGTGGSIYSSVESNARSKESEKAAAKLAADQAAAAKAAAAPKPGTASNFPDIAAQMRAKLAADKSAQPGLSSDFYAQDLEQGAPGFEELARSIVSGDTGSK